MLSSLLASFLSLCMMSVLAGSCETAAADLPPQLPTAAAAGASCFKSTLLTSGVTRPSFCTTGSKETAK